MSKDVTKKMQEFNKKWINLDPDSPESKGCCLGSLTAPDITATDGNVVTNDTITNNLRVRVNELEAILQEAGLLG